MAQADDLGIYEYELDNGLTVLVRPDHRAPVAVSQLWYRVGSSYEYRGVTGISHMLEHMMFKGTERLAPGEFSHIIARHGGRDNAMTGRDFTAYHQQLAADRLAIAFELEADRMHRLQLTEEEFVNEMEVVKEERRQRVDDIPTAVMMERFFATAYTSSTYHQPIIGWQEDLDNMTLDDVQAWYDRWYGPDNAILIVVGDVEPEAVRDLAAEYFGDVPARDIAPPKPSHDIPAPGERRIAVRIPAEVPVIVMGYQVPSGATADEEWETYALTVLATVLSGGSAARLPSQLVRGQEIAASAGASYSPIARLDTLFLFSANPAGDTGLDTLEQALNAEIERAREEPISEAELERAQNQIMADHLFELDSMFYQAMQIGMLETADIGWRELERFEAGIRSVTPEQVQQVAQRYLIPDRLTVGLLEPIRQGGEQE
ncbi:peptidase M16 [Alkalilimnicola ehrlichii]|uniref:Peptidase M16 n=2 Tax=Alkalilimnicola ehrlichii TaxID=351052 RepID=A0A3E0WZD9_9GAMM|nr:peptidase M16 [Alkalilimnicola ehrlichii]RFA37523.1 peptidase M16 [Alkalilimnicola ehrlichii]